MYKSEKIIVKIGTKALSTPTGEPDEALIASLAAEIAAHKKLGHDVIIVSSGAIGTGRAHIRNAPFPKKILAATDRSFFGAALSITNRKLVTEKQISALIGQEILESIYRKLFAAHGLDTHMVLLKQNDLAAENLAATASSIANIAKDPTAIPIVNEDDTQPMIGTPIFHGNDELTALLAKPVSANRVIFLSDVKGVFDRHPNDPTARLHDILDFSDVMPLNLHTSGTSDGGTGGMISKLKAVRKLSKNRIYSHIDWSRTPDVISKIMRGYPTGTSIGHDYKSPPRSLGPRLHTSEL